jgi:hypothetical protein
MKERNRQKSQVLAAMQLFNFVLVILQMWLFVGSLENGLRGDFRMALPGAAASVLILGVNIWILLGVFRLDREP